MYLTFRQIVDLLDLDFAHFDGARILATSRNLAIHLEHIAQFLHDRVVGEHGRRGGPSHLLIWLIDAWVTVNWFCWSLLLPLISHLNYNYNQNQHIAELV